MRYLIVLIFAFWTSVSYAQWAVYGDKLTKEVRKINNVQKINLDKLKDFEKLERLDVDFASLTSLTDEDKCRIPGDRRGA